MHRGGGSGVVVDNMDNWIHFDGTWFHVIKDGIGVYLHPSENTPSTPRAQNKRFITKYMFLAAAAWPRKICTAIWFDSKSNISPIVDILLSKRDCKNPEKGIPIMNLATVNGERYKKLMIEEIIPAMKARIPRPPGHSIFVQ
ncbi:unnamed protein product [Discosporangium mesarthrocarpum]